MPRRRGKSRNYQSSSPAVTNSVVSTPRSGRRSAATASASKVAPGRSTHNSRGTNRGRRGPGSGRKTAANGRTSTRGRGRTSKKDSTPLQDPTSYKDENGEVYRIGGLYNYDFVFLLYVCVHTLSNLIFFLSLLLRQILPMWTASNQSYPTTYVSSMISNL